MTSDGNTVEYSVSPKIGDIGPPSDAPIKVLDLNAQELGKLIQEIMERVNAVSSQGY